MKFYYRNNMGDAGYFYEDNLIKAVYAAWNIEAMLYWVKDRSEQQIIFSPLEDNDVNSRLLREFGYYMKDGKHRREIREIDTDQRIRYDWSEVRSLTV